jgi:transposase
MMRAARWPKASTRCRRRRWPAQELNVRRLVDTASGWVRQRVELNNTLQWNLHDPSTPSSCCRAARCSRRSGPAGSAGAWREPSRRCTFGSRGTSCAGHRELTQAISVLETEIAELVAKIAPQLLSEPGLGPPTAAKLVGEIAGAARFATDAKLARAAGPALNPVSSGKTNRHRLGRGGRRATVGP